jgi:hypothetical protein
VVASSPSFLFLLLPFASSSLFDHVSGSSTDGFHLPSSSPPPPNRPFGWPWPLRRLHRPNLKINFTWQFQLQFIVIPSFLRHFCLKNFFFL